MQKISFKVPIPATYYEAIHAQEYFDYCVMKYDMSTILNPPATLSGTSISELAPGAWKVIAADDEATMQAMKEKVRSMTALTPAQRRELVAKMKMEKVEEFQPLIRNRDKKVHEVIVMGEYLAKLDMGNPQYQYCLESVVEGLEELLPIHTSIIVHVPSMEDDSGSELPDTRNWIQAFHRHFRRYTCSIIPFNNDGCHQRLVKLVEQMDRLRETTFIEHASQWQTTTRLILLRAKTRKRFFLTLWHASIKDVSRSARKYVPD
jgi:hypothetical protein